MMYTIPIRTLDLAVLLIVDIVVMKKILFNLSDNFNKILAYTAYILLRKSIYTFYKKYKNIVWGIHFQGSCYTTAIWEVAVSQALRLATLVRA